MSDTQLYRIGLHGCDDSTYINIDLTDKEYDLIARIAVLSEEESDYGCMPTLRVDKVKQHDT